MGKHDEVPNQVFIGAPWKTVRQKYEWAISELKKSFPLSFVIVGRDNEQDAKELLEIIKEKLLSSSYAVFDATGGNANVSLEYGFAEASEIPRALYLNIHKAGHRSSKDLPIIADLAGKKRMHYTQKARLKSLLSTFANDHPYAKRFERFLLQKFKRAKKGTKHRMRTLALKVIHCLDDKVKVRREDIVQQLLADHSIYKRPEIEEMLQRLHQVGLIECSVGRFSDVFIR